MEYDVLVIGGGHAGTEAAGAAARFGARVALITHSKATIGAMSCNPAIGGLGKGQLVREIDALDGLMGRAIDQAGIQFKMLNRSKGAAVQGPRAQADRRLYAHAIQTMLRRYSNLDVLEDEVCAFESVGNRLTGVRTKSGVIFSCKSVVLTTGTFLRGLIHLGATQNSGGRFGDPASTDLSAALMNSGVSLGRLKTGTPARLDGRTINWAACERQTGDDAPTAFSWMTDRIVLPQITCGITRTNFRTHQIIADNISKSAVYSGAISGSGPRYCPSIEDKVTRFSDRSSHQIFLEPEGLDDATVYPNGVSTSLPAEVQDAFIRSIEGLERVHILRYGYAIEYDYADPKQLHPSLQSRKQEGLFFAGQINGTTGYEEAGGQGIVAGMNAARYAANMPPVLFSRDNSYIGVMIDDLVRFGVSEPYRMFTSRCEYRLTIRADNADFRLTPLGREAGIVGDDRWAMYCAKERLVTQARSTLCQMVFTPQEAMRLGFSVNQDGVRRSAFDLLSYEGFEFSTLAKQIPALQNFPDWVGAYLKTEAHYAVYITRQQGEIDRLRLDREIGLAVDFDYASVSGLSNEIKAKLMRSRPSNLAEAGDIEGMTPSALVLLATIARRTNMVTVR